MKSTAEYIALLRGYMQKNASRYGIVRMGIFGSVARNEQTEYSDVDVYVEGELRGFFVLSGIKCEKAIRDRPSCLKIETTLVPSGLNYCETLNL